MKFSVVSYTYINLNKKNEQIELITAKYKHLLHDINSSVNYPFACTRNLNFILQLLPEKNTATTETFRNKTEIIPYPIPTNPVT